MTNLTPPSASTDNEREGLEELVTLHLVPVQVFGAGRCPAHSSDADGNNPTLCSICSEDVEGYGLMDAVSSWSDCNRATGKIYRVDDSWAHRNRGETVEIIVKKKDLPFFERRWCDE